MRPGGGKTKGAHFERSVCVALSKWISNGERDDCFWRSAMSGGRATNRLKLGQRAETQSGDISAIHPLGNLLTDRFSIECKFVKKLRLDLFMFGGGPTADFWRQAETAAHAHNKHPMLIAKSNFGSTYVITDRFTLGTLVDISVPHTEISVVGEEGISCAIIPFNALLLEPCKLVLKPTSKKRVRLLLRG